MRCPSAETGTLVFAIVNIVTVFLSTLLGVWLLVTWILLINVGSSLIRLLLRFEHVSDSNEHEQPLFPIVAIMIFLFTSVVDLVLSAFLLSGRLKKKPNHLKAYLIFGVLKVILEPFLLGGFYYGLKSFVFDAYNDSNAGNTENTETFGIAATMIFAYVIGAIVYGSILFMINITYKQYKLAEPELREIKLPVLTPTV